MRGILFRVLLTITVSLVVSLAAACSEAGDAESDIPVETAARDLSVTGTTPSPATPGEPEVRVVQGPEPQPTSGRPVATTTPRPQQNLSATPLVTAPPLGQITKRAPSSVVTPVVTAPSPQDLTQVSATNVPVEARAGVGRVATARGVDGLQRPVEETMIFSSRERVYIAVEFIGVEAGAELGFAWKADAGCSGSFTTDSQPAIRRGFFGFFIDRTECVGRYDVRILVDGIVIAKTNFSVGKVQPTG